MAEFGVAMVGGGFALAAAGYTTGTGFAARHENAHAQQVAQTKQLIAEFEEAYQKEEVGEHDWKEFLALREDVREKESMYDDSIEAYKETPMYHFVRKWKAKREVRRQKRGLKRANKTLRSHYYESTSDASDTSSTNASCGSPPRSRKAYGNEDRDDEAILSWAKDVANSDSDNESVNDDDDWEPVNISNGCHQVMFGDTFSDGRYVVVGELRSGPSPFSSLRVARDKKMNRFVALKVVKSIPLCTKIALDKIKLLQRLVTSSTPPTASTPAHPNPPPLPAHTHPGRSHIISFLDHFTHKGRKGIHVCMVFEVLGKDLLGLIKRYQNMGVPIPLVKQIAKQILLGLDYIHQCCGVIHTDLKPETVLICIDRGGQDAPSSAMPINHQQLQEEEKRTNSVNRSHKNVALENITVKIAYFENATWTTHDSTDDIQTRQYRSPEVILGAKWGPSSDLWSVACILFELITGGDYLFDPASSDSQYSKEDGHIAQIIELMGKIPKSIASSGRYSHRYFDNEGELRYIKKLRHWPLESVLHKKYLFLKLEANAIASFLLPMLRLDPCERAKASEMTNHLWLDGIIVQGEIDVIRRMEIDKEVRRAILSGGGGEVARQEQIGSSPRSRESEWEEGRLDLSMRDAMKPVDESVLINGEEDGDNIDDQHNSHHSQQHHSPVRGALHQSPRESWPEMSRTAIARALQQANTTPPPDINSVSR